MNDVVVSSYVDDQTDIVSESGYSRRPEDQTDSPERGIIRLFAPGPTFRVPLFAISDGERELATDRALEIQIARGEDGFFAENEKLDVYAFGSTMDEAVLCFSRILIDMFDHYKQSDPDQLHAHAAELKRLYGETFEDV